MSVCLSVDNVSPSISNFSPYCVVLYCMLLYTVTTILYYTELYSIV